MKEALWRIVAHVVSRPRVATWLIERSKRTPYCPIQSRDGSSVYMERYWLFNPYGKDADGNQIPARWAGLPSIRVQVILRADDDDHEHNHPWPGRSIILRNHYDEERREEYAGRRRRKAGDTVLLKPDTFHRISYVPIVGVYTLFFTWGTSQGWGFKVNGRVVPWRKYLKVDA